MANVAKHDKVEKQDETETRAAWWFPPARWWPELVSSFDDHMRVEEFTDGDELVVRAEMPGLDPDKDVEITMSDHTLHLRAERRQESRTDEKGWHKSEFRYGSFARNVALPAGATDQDVKASYDDGILEVRIPIDEKGSEARKIPVTHG